MLLTKDDKLRTEFNSSYEILQSNNLSELTFETKLKVETPNVGSAKLLYKNWFQDKFQDKSVGKVSEIWPNKKVIAVEAEIELKEEEYIMLTKFLETDELNKLIFRIDKENLWDYDKCRANF